MHSLWFSLYNSGDYKSDELAFPLISNYTGINKLAQNYEVIYGELEQYLSTFEMQPQFNDSMVEIPKSWKVRSLRVWGVDMYREQRHFKRTMRLLDNIPNVVNIGFNLLEPGSKIKPHYGDTNAILRCHLGLKIPLNSGLCSLKVKGEVKHWHKGEVIAFNDAFQHEAWNESNEQRVILLFDILKPEFKNQQNEVCATVLTSFYMQQIGNFWPRLYKINRRFFRYFLFPVVCFFRVSIPVRNRIKKWFIYR